MTEITHEFKVGSLWEEGPWELIENYDASEYGGPPCPHCFNIRKVTHKRHDGSTYEEGRYTCPAVIVLSNECGHNSTGLCLDCLLDAVRSIGIRSI
jgi:hypothetical protein